MHLVDQLMEFIEERLALVLQVSILLQFDFILPLCLFELALKSFNFYGNFLEVTFDSLMADLLFLKLLFLLLGSLKGKGDTLVLVVVLPVFLG